MHSGLTVFSVVAELLVVHVPNSFDLFWFQRTVPATPGSACRRADLMHQSQVSPRVLQSQMSPSISQRRLSHSSAVTHDMGRRDDRLTVQDARTVPATLQHNRTVVQRAGLAPSPQRAGVAPPPQRAGVAPPAQRAGFAPPPRSPRAVAPPPSQSSPVSYRTMYVCNIDECNRGFAYKKNLITHQHSKHSQHQ